MEILFGILSWFVDCLIMYWYFDYVDLVAYSISDFINSKTDKKLIKKYNRYIYTKKI